jgi:hypothetical protein
VRLLNGLVEDRGVGRHAADVTAFDERPGLAVFEQAALDIIHPDGLSKLDQLLNIVHVLSSFCDVFKDAGAGSEMVTPGTQKRKAAKARVGARVSASLRRVENH